MILKQSDLELAQKETEKVINRVNKKISELGENTNKIYLRLCMVQETFEVIRNVPSDQKLEYEKLVKIRQDWKQQVDQINSDYKKATAKGARTGIVGVGAGVAVAALGPSAAMGIATTFGVASTGTAISALSGAAATNAALAWLGGGVLAAGGGGMTAGNALLAMAGPVGWTIAGAAVLSSAVMLVKNKQDKKCLENIYTLISKRDTKNYELAIVEINERIQRINNETYKLTEAYKRILTFGLDYSKMTEEQQYELGAYVNLMNASTQLLVNPIMGLQPKYSDSDFWKYLNCKAPKEGPGVKGFIFDYKDLFLTLANLLYGIPMDKRDEEILWKSLRKNKEFLSTMHISKDGFEKRIMDYVRSALIYKEK